MGQASREHNEPALVKPHPLLAMLGAGSGATVGSWDASRDLDSEVTQEIPGVQSFEPVSMDLF